jgi:hypothetical protein
MNPSQPMTDDVPATGLKVPLQSADPKRYYRCLLGPLALGLSVGMQVTITAFLLLGPATVPGLADQLTSYGASLVRPEHDLLIYVAGAAFTVLMPWFLVWYWRGKVNAVEQSRAPGFMTAAALLQGMLAAASMVVYALLLFSRWFATDYLAAPASRPALGEFEAVRLLVPSLMALVCTVVDLEWGLDQSARSAGRFDRANLSIGRLLRYAVPVFIVLVVGVSPGRWRYLAGQVLGTDGCQHLNFFVMGPALSFSHGKAFGTEIYSQYGIGWPLLASALRHLGGLTYANLVGMEIVYGCVYYVALFFLLRACLKQEIWAAFAVVLAISWQIFSGLRVGEFNWTYPSSTMMRHPLDVWFFAALFLHQRSGKAGWVALAGVAGGLGVTFETETGAYLLVTFVIYAALQVRVESNAGRATWKALLGRLAVFGGAVVATAFPLLLYASRGTLFTRAFAEGWVEALFLFGSSGVGALPVAALPDSSLAAFMIMTATYLAMIAFVGLRALHRKVSSGEVLLGTLAAYGLAVLLLFVGRSHPFNLCHAAPPFAVLVTALLLRCHRALPGALLDSALPGALAVGVVLLLLTKPQFRTYPSLLGSGSQGPPPTGLSLRTNPPDICGLPPNFEPFVSDVREICSAVQTLAPDGKGVAILDLNDTMLYSVADACPWSRYTSLFRIALTHQLVDHFRDELIACHSKYVLIRGASVRRPPNWEFIWAPLYETVTNRYVLHQNVGPYEVWRHSRQP